MTVKVGETLPESFFQATHQAVDMQTGEETTVRLEDYRDKLIILDFWATWCSPCIYSLNKLDSIQRDVVSPGFVVIPVTYQKAKEAALIRGKYGWDMVSIVSDTMLGKIFPHSGIPHMVWIKGGKVHALPRTEEATASNLIDLSKGEEIQVSSVEQYVNPKIPLFGIGGSDNSIHLMSTVFGGNTAYVSQRLQTVRHGDSTIVYCANVSMEYILHEAYKDQLFPLYQMNQKAGLLWLINDSLKMRLFSRAPLHAGRNSVKYVEWKKNCQIGYQLISTCRMAPSDAFSIMRRDLNNYLTHRYGIEAQIEKIPTDFMVLRLQDNNKLISKGGVPNIRKSADSIYLRNMPLSRLKSELAVRGDNSRILDETGFSGFIDAVLPREPALDYESVNSVLNPLGLTLTKETRRVPMLVIRKI